MPLAINSLRRFFRDSSVFPKTEDFPKKNAVIANGAERSEAICQVPADFFLYFSSKFKVCSHLKDIYSAGTWQIASFRCAPFAMTALF